MSQAPGTSTSAAADALPQVGAYPVEQAANGTEAGGPQGVVVVRLQTMKDLAIKDEAGQQKAPTQPQQSNEVGCVQSLAFRRRGLGSGMHTHKADL